jgi:hypothetical protein
MRKRALAIVACALLSTLAFAYEPDVTQQRMEDDSALLLDHLIPSGSEIPETPPLYYIAKFGRYPSFADAFEWQLVQKNGKYTLSSWRLSQKDKAEVNPPRLDEMSIEIPMELSATVYSIWANGILDARYTRHTFGTDGTSYSFSTYLRGVGWPSAWAWSPSGDLPPKWLVEAGEEVLAYGRAKKPDAVVTHHRLQAIAKRLTSHRSAHSKFTQPNTAMEPTR